MLGVQGEAGWRSDDYGRARGADQQHAGGGRSGAPQALFSPNLYVGGYAGYEFGAQDVTVLGVNSTFSSHTFKLGGTIGGDFVCREFTVTPSASALIA